MSCVDPSMIIKSSQFLLRPFAESDASSFAAAIRESGATVGRWMSWAHAEYSEAEAMSWFATCATERAKSVSYEFGIFDAESQSLVGGCGLNQFNVVNGFCNLGYWVRESWQRRGAGMFAIQSLKSFAFRDLAQGRVEIVVAAGNFASQALAERAGATRECLSRNRLKLHGTFTGAYVFSLVPEQS